MFSELKKHIVSLFPEDYISDELKIVENKDNSISFFFYNILALKYKKNKKHELINFALKKEQIIIAPENDMSDIKNEITKDFLWCRANRDFEFDCCSLFLQCSDAKTCVSPYKEFMLTCRYSEKLNNNIIFYGKHRNV